MKLSVVIITYHRGILLHYALESTYSQSGLPPYEVIVIDNGGDAEVVYPSDPSIELHVIQAEKNLGVAGGRNEGMRKARGEYLIFIDDDAEWNSDRDILHLVEHLERDAKTGAVAVQSLDPEGQTILGDLPHPDKDRILASVAPIKVPYFYGVAHALRASVIQETGHYPDEFQYGNEEFDLSLRLYDQGYHIVYDPAITVTHYHSPEGRPAVGRDYWYAVAFNKSQVAFRLLPFPYFLTIPVIWGFWAVVKTGQPSTGFQIWHDLWKRRRLLWQQRQPIRPATVQELRRIGARLLY